MRALDTSRPQPSSACTGDRRFLERTGQGRRHHHRHRRQRHLARAPELLRPHRQQRQRHQGRQAGLPADPRLARQVHAGRAVQRIDCNQKLIGARYYNAGWGGNAGIDDPLPVRVQLAARLRRPRHAHRVDRRAATQTSRPPAPPRCSARISGIAPRARIAAYKVCWGDDGAAAAAARPSTASPPSTRPSPTASTSSTSRSAARSTNFLDAVEVAFLFAADAGVFVATSAGNSGPTRQHRRAPEPVADHGGRRHAQPRRRRLGDAGQRRHLLRRLGRAPRWLARR